MRNSKSIDEGANFLCFQGAAWHLRVKMVDLHDQKCASDQTKQLQVGL